jgi:nucleoid-associated protein YgaU
MMTQTPTVASKSDNAADVAAPAAGDATPADSATAQPLAAGNPADQASAAAAAAADTATAANPPVDADKSASGLVAENAAPTTTQPSASAERTHVVQPGEMLTSIAAAAYGDSRKWKQIADANPNVDPDRMKPGTKLVIPVLAAYTQPGSHQTAASTAAIDTRTQYRVQPNDSLYRISLKLYGKADHVDQLYSDNKDVIGADPRRLKLDMILKLSDPPTAGVSQ